MISGQDLLLNTQLRLAQLIVGVSILVIYVLRCRVSKKPSRALCFSPIDTACAKLKRILHDTVCIW